MSKPNDRTAEAVIGNVAARLNGYPKRDFSIADVVDEAAASTTLVDAADWRCA